ncbi:MAG TPA: carbon-nitrogen family hydrolase [Candidatus Limnocylindria bacterium]|nr:carbon-nitrogen family hydrolase [Candidatus Limnocylindria bacterium]
MRIDVLQLAPDYDATIDARRASALQDVRACAGADLVVLPELWPQGGFTYARWADEAEPVDGPTVSALGEVARELGAHVHAGSIIERDGDGRLFNTSVLLDPAGAVVVTYRKIHLFGFAEGEPTLLSAGTDVVVADTALGPIGLATCYDLRFPEMFRALVDAGAELVLIPAAWPAVRVDHWSLLARARAVEDQVVVVAANTAGQQAGKQMGGRSVVVDAQGTVLAEAGDAAERMSVDVELDDVRAWRERFPVLGDRRL